VGRASQSEGSVLCCCSREVVEVSKFRSCPPQAWHCRMLESTSFSQQFRPHAPSDECWIKSCAGATTRPAPKLASPLAVM
jgi:hypothetical protein